MGLKMMKDSLFPGYAGIKNDCGYIRSVKDPASVFFELPNRDQPKWSSDTRNACTTMGNFRIKHVVAGSFGRPVRNCRQLTSCFLGQPLLLDNILTNWGGLYLKTITSGGICEEVNT